MPLHHGLRAAAGASPADPYFSSTSLLLLGNGTNGGQNNTFVDSSTNNFTITRNGNTTQGSFSPFTGAGGSGYFDGGGDYLSISSNTAFNIGTGSYTVECWIYVTQVDAFSVFFTAGTNGIQFGLNASSYIALAQTSVGFELSSTTSLPVNQWNHLVAVRGSSNTTSLYLNGSRIANGTVSTNYSYSTNYVNYNPEATSADFVGFVSGLRVIKGTAVYDPTLTTLTVPTSPLTAITNTSLLLNFTNASILDSTAKNDLETVGDAQVSTSVKKFGTGSLKFDGTGDYLVSYSSSTASLMNFGTGDFTIEMWLYFSSTSGNQGIVDNASSISSALSGKWFLYKDSSGNLIFGEHNVGAILSYSWSPSTSTWYFIAVSRSGGTIKMFINGTSVASASNSTNFSSAGGVQVGIMASINPLNGYIDDLRITKGVARYTAAFTPPSAQLPSR